MLLLCASSAAPIKAGFLLPPHHSLDPCIYICICFDGLAFQDVDSNDPRGLYRQELPGYKLSATRICYQAYFRPEGKEALCQILVASSDYFLSGLLDRCTACVSIQSEESRFEAGIDSLHSVYVGMPKIAQHQVDDSHLEFREAFFLNPTPESVEVTQKAVLHNPSTFTPTLDPFAADLFLVTAGTYASVSMLTLPMPGIHAKKATNASIDNQVIKINNVDALGDYAVAVMNNENITTALVGRTKLHLGKLPTQKIKFNSTSTYKSKF